MENRPIFQNFRKYLLFLVMSLSLLSCQEEELESFSSELEITETISYQFNSLDENEIQENSFLQKHLFNKNQ